MSKPIIGIAPQYDYEKNRVWVGPAYLDAIRTAGGIPILLPLHIEKEDLEVAANACDGFLFTGGPDISPFRFGEETIRQCGVIVPDRDKLEEDLFQIAMQMNKPIFGICRGIQVLNVFLGGTLYQDIASQYPTDLDICHSQPSGNAVLTHSVTIDKDSMLYNIVGKEYMQVNSFHHQAIKDLAPTLKIAGVSADSLIEAVYLPAHPFFLGIQWHPEHLFRDYADELAIFKAFVNACKD